jgi:hypothetical protein
LHHSEGERLRWLAEWCELGLRDGDKVVYVDVAGWGPEALTNALAGRGLDVSEPLEKGQFEFVGLAALTELGTDGDDLVMTALAAGYSAVRLTVRQDALAALIGDQEAELVEQRIAASCHEAPLSVLCQYDGRTTVGESLTQALDQHPDWVFEGELSVHHRGHLIQVEGLLDTLDENVLLRSLNRMTRWLSLSEPLALDLRGVKALSSGAGKAVLTGTEAFRRRGGTVEVGVPSGAGADMVRVVLQQGNAAHIHLK